MADKAGVGYATVARFEAGAAIADTSRDKLRLALEASGARFSDWRDRVGVTVTRAKTFGERKADMKDAKAALAKVRNLTRTMKAGVRPE